MPQDVVAVVVASSNVGRATIQGLMSALSADSGLKQRWKVRAVLRDIGKLDSSWTSHGIEVLGGLDTSNPSSLHSAFNKVTKALIVPPQAKNRDEIVSKLLEAAKEEGVAHVVLIGGVFQEEEKFLFHRHWMSSRRKACELGLLWTQLECSDFMENLLGSSRDIQQGKLHGAFSHGTSSPVAVSDVGKAAAAVLLDPSGQHWNKAYRIVGPEALAPTDVARILSEVRGDPVHFLDVGLEESNKRAHASGKQPWQVEGFADWLQLYFSTGRLKEVKTDLPHLGVTPLALRQWILNHLEAFLPIQVASAVKES